MNQDSKSILLVHTELAQAECPVWEKLNALGYEIIPFSTESSTAP